MAAKARMTAFGLLGIFLLSLVTVFPTVSAQNAIGVVVAIGAGSEELLAPDVEISRSPVDVTLSMPAASGCTAVITVNYGATGPSYATTFMNPSAFTFTYQSPETVPFASAAGNNVPLETELVATVTREAPAYLSAEYTVTASVAVQSQTCTFAAGSGSQRTTIKNDYFPLLEAIPQRSLGKASQNQQFIFPVDITNRGNGETRVSSEATYTSSKQLDSLIPPPPFTLESRAQQGTAAKVTKTQSISVRTPHQNGYTNAVYSFKVDFAGEYAGAKPTGVPIRDTQSVFLSLQVQGVYAPGFDPALAVGALGIALLGMRRFITS